MVGEQRSLVFEPLHRVDGAAVVRAVHRHVLATPHCQPFGHNLGTKRRCGRVIKRGENKTHLIGVSLSQIGKRNWRNLFFIGTRSVGQARWYGKMWEHAPNCSNSQPIQNALTSPYSSHSSQIVLFFSLQRSSPQYQEISRWNYRAHEALTLLT